MTVEVYKTKLGRMGRTTALANNAASTEDPRLVHPAAMRRLKPLDSEAPKGIGVLKIDGLDEIISDFKAASSVKKLQGKFDFAHKSKLKISNCRASTDDIKRDTKVSHSDQPFPDWFCLDPKPMAQQDVGNAEAFVALSMGPNGCNKVNVRYLLHRENIGIHGLIDVLHVVQAVSGHDLYELFTERQNLFYLNPTNVPLMVIRDNYCKLLQQNCDNVDQKCLEPPDPLCFTPVSTETAFIDPNLSSKIPHHQLVLNGMLSVKQTAALGVQLRLPNEGGVVIAPLFSVNADSHWRFPLRTLADVLTKWTGSLTLVNVILQELPCVMTARNRYIHDLMQDCLEELKKPKKVSVCSQCGQSFEYNRYILSETRRYHIHLQSHQLDCKVCGAHFTNCQLRKFHERSHKEGSFYCPNSRCNYVGRSQKSIESHVRYKHTPEQCKYCGKGFKNMKSLTLHQEVFHLPNRPKEHQCEHCGKAYRSKLEMEKHVSRQHTWTGVGMTMKEEEVVDPSTHKFECTKHVTCKKFFKTAPSLKAHLTKYKDRDHPPEMGNSLSDTNEMAAASKSPALKSPAIATKKKKPGLSKKGGKSINASLTSTPGIEVESLASVHIATQPSVATASMGLPQHQYNLVVQPPSKKS